MGKDNKCGCSPLDNYTVCNEQSEVSSDDVEIISNANSILPTDEILIIRKNCKESKVYKAEWNDLSPNLALFILSKAVQAMPKTDPNDGQSPWNNNGVISIASDPFSILS